MDTANHNFLLHVNIWYIRVVLGWGRCFLFHCDGSTEGKRCLVLPIVTTCRIV